MTSTHLFLITFGSIAGAAIGSLGIVPQLPVAVHYLALLVVVAAAFLCAKQNHRALLVGVFVCSMSVGLIRAHNEITHSYVLATFADTPQTEVIGVVVSEPDMRERTVQYRVRVETVNSTPLDELLLIMVPLHTAFARESRITLVGTIQLPEPFYTESGRLFAYPKWLLKDSICCTMHNPRIVAVAPATEASIATVLSTIKRALVSAIESALPEPHAAFGSGLLLGARHALGEEILLWFQITGLSHIVVLSGYNLAIIAEVIRRLTARFSRTIAFGISICATVLFAMMVGGGATVMRATIMALIVLLAQYTGRPYTALYALMLAAIGMVLHSPLIVLYDPGFQLSFVATLSLILFAPAIEKYLEVRWSFFARFPTLCIIAASTIAAQIGVTPLLIYMMGTVSLVSLPANLLVLPLIPVSMAFVALTAFASLLHSGLAAPFAVVSWIFLHTILTIAEWFASIPFASVTVPIWFSAISAIAVLLFMLHQRTKSRVNSLPV